MRPSPGSTRSSDAFSGRSVSTSDSRATAGSTLPSAQFHFRPGLAVPVGRSIWVHPTDDCPARSLPDDSPGFRAKPERTAHDCPEPGRAHRSASSGRPRTTQHNRCRHNNTVGIVSAVTSQEFKRWLQKQGCTFEPGHGGHLIVRLGMNVSVLPMHDRQKELGSGLVNAIKKQLGLK